jgi:hypothetical protein
MGVSVEANFPFADMSAMAVIPLLQQKYPARNGFAFLPRRLDRCNLKYFLSARFSTRIFLWESTLHRIRGAGSMMFTIRKSLVRNADTVECGMVRLQKQ